MRFGEENRYLSYGDIQNELLENDGEIGEGDRLGRSRRRLISRTIFSTGSFIVFKVELNLLLNPSVSGLWQCVN